MFNQAHDFWFGLAFMFMLAGLFADAAATRYGIWDYGFVEGNPLYKLLPASWQTFIFKTAGGTFADGAFRVLLTTALIVTAVNTGYANDSGAWVPATIGSLSLGVAIRNFILIRKQAAAAAKTLAGVKK